MAALDAGRFQPYYTNSRRDSARRYIDSDTGEVVSRRRAEQLTALHKERGYVRSKPSGVPHKVYRLKKSPYEKKGQEGPSYTRHGPFYSLQEITHYNRIPDETRVTLSAYGCFRKNVPPMKSPQTGCGYRVLIGWTPFSTLKKNIIPDSLNKKPRLAAAIQLQENSADFETIERYYVTVEL